MISVAFRHPPVRPTGRPRSRTGRASSPADCGLRRLPGVAIAAVGTEIVNFV